MKTELRACPFCGKKRHLRFEPFEGSTDTGIVVCICGASYTTISQGIDDWNTRPIEDGLNKQIAELEGKVRTLEADNAKLKQELAKLTSRETGIVDMEGTPIEVGDTVRVRGLFEFGITEVDFSELCIVEKTNGILCHAVNERTIHMGDTSEYMQDMYYGIDYFPLEESSEEGNDFLVVKKWNEAVKRIRKERE